MMSKIDAPSSVLSGFKAKLALLRSPKATHVRTLRKRVQLSLVLIFVVFSPFSAYAGISAQSDGIIRVMALGDSLSAGYQLPTGNGFAPVLERWLNDHMEGPVKVQAAGVSGDTSSGGLTRLNWTLAGAGGTTDLVILELGANDGLRGITPDLTRENLDNIITQLKAKNIKVLLAGMMAAPSMGSTYQSQFDSIYPDLAESHDIPLYPFFLDGVAAIPELNLADGIHPTEEGIEIIVERIGPFVLKALQ